MAIEKLKDLTVWKELASQARRMDLSENHLRHLLQQDDRLASFSLRGAGLFFDHSRQRVDKKIVELLLDLAEKRQVAEQFAAMVSGKRVNTTENRAALHTATRNFSKPAVYVDGEDIMPGIERVRKAIHEFSKKIHAGALTGTTGKPFRHVVVIGIGGSYLGTDFVAQALKAYSVSGMRIHFLSNVDIQDFGRVSSEIDPETTLWVVISKSYTTTETLANANQAAVFMKERGLDPARHFVTVTSKGSPGDHAGGEILESFHMYDYIGGRYSVTSAVGGVPLSLFLGFDCFEEFLKGAEEVDLHAANAPPDQNLPLMAALISIWNINFLGYPAQAVIPYADPLKKLPAHIQQLYMESNGKSVTREGDPVAYATGAIVFGEPGTNAQHSFFQLAHQGQPFPIDFIGVLKPQYMQYQATSKGVTNHQELWANLISQPLALAIGQDTGDPPRYFPGNRPSSTLLLGDLSPKNVGRLLAFYEARTVFEAFVWGINPFDQFGVELGKRLASDIRKEMKTKNENRAYGFDENNSIAHFYLNTLFSGKL